jgi:hypothetical protein
MLVRGLNAGPFHFLSFLDANYYLHKRPVVLHCNRGESRAP